MKQIISSLSIIALFFVSFFAIAPTFGQVEAACPPGISTCSPTGCPQGKICAFQTGLWGQPMYYWTPQPAGVCTNTSGAWNDSIRSIEHYNAASGGLKIHWYNDANCTGTRAATMDSTHWLGSCLPGQGQIVWSGGSCSSPKISSFMRSYGG